jgi:hypothetical protein
MANESIQRETALFWFISNLKPYELGPGPWFGFGNEKSSSAQTGTGPRDSGDPSIGGFGQASFAPSPLQAGPILQEQFGEDLPDDWIRALGVALEGNWMWIEQRISVERVDDAPPSRSNLQAGLNDLEDFVRKCTPIHGGIGHNSLDQEVLYYC